MPDTVSRTVKSIQVKASTSSAGLLVNNMTMQQNLEPQQGAVIPITYIDYNYDLGQYDLGWNYDGTLIEDGNIPIIDIASPTGFKFGAGGGINILISIGGLVPNGAKLGPPAIVPRNCTVLDIYTYCREGSCSVTVSHGPITMSSGSTLSQYDILDVNVAGASDDCEDLTVLVRCI